MSWPPPSPRLLAAVFPTPGESSAHESVCAEARTWTTHSVPHVEAPSSRSEWRALRERARSALDDCAQKQAEYVVVHAGDHAPDTELVETAIDALLRPIDRGAAATEPGVREIADICIADDGTESLLSLTWQTLAQRGENAVTLRSHHDPLDRRAPEQRPDETLVAEQPMFVVRRSATVDFVVHAERSAWKRPSWWAATLAVMVFTIWHLAEIVSGAVDTTATELLWLDAAERGSVNGNIISIGGTGVWAGLMEPIVRAFGTSGVRLTSLTFAVVAVASAANASSRLFGRWAARSTAVALITAMSITGVATETTSTTLVLLAIAVSLQGIALAASTDRPSWLMMSAAASSLAFAVRFQSIAVVVALVVVTAVACDPRRRVSTQAYLLMFMASTAWWFIPLDLPVSAYVTVVRNSLGPVEVGDVTSRLGLAAAVAIGGFLIARFTIASMIVRRRIVALTLAAASLPIVRLAVGASMQPVDWAMTSVLLAPALGGIVAHALARITRGEQIEPARRTTPDLLKNDPSTGVARGSHVRFTNRQMYLAGIMLVLSALWFFPWAIPHMSWASWWLAVPFLLCNVMVASTASLLIFNNARQSIPLEISVAAGHEPLVGVIVPMVDEPTEMVDATVRSVIDQDWPIDKLRIVVSDDGHSDDVKAHFEALASTLPDGVLQYFRPPKRGTPGRIGESKSGNLNAAILPLSDAHCEYIETRDADDLVGCSNFLRATIGHMMNDDRIAYVQTIKESHTSDGDPFNNNEVLFYRGMTLARNMHHAALPCGSGLVWRRAALRDIGHFPVWNLVEDIHSGVLALRAGWRGLFVPVVGSFAQHAPEDIANYFKQRGTWAMDSIRLVFFDRFRGIPWRARLQLFEQTAFYLLSVPVMGLLICPIFGLVLGRYPIEANGMDYALHFTGFALSLELCMFAFASGKPIGAYARTRLFLVGMAPLYAASVVRALWYGANRKPIYIVTRKAHQHRVYFRMLRIHWLLIGAISAALVFAFVRRDQNATFDPGIIYWALAGIAGLGSFVRLSWFGVDVRDLWKQLRGRDDHAVEPPG